MVTVRRMSDLPAWPDAPMDTLLRDAVEWVRPAVAAVTAADLARPTPCAEWAVTDLLAHMIGALADMRFTASKQLADHAQVFGRTPAPALAVSPLEAFEAAAAVTLAAWSAPGALVGNTPLPVGFEVPAVMAAGINFFDTLVHGWDLRMALGLDAEMPAHLAEAALAVTQTIVSADVRALVGFDPERRPMDAGSATERLVAFLGRPTSWR